MSPQKQCLCQRLVLCCQGTDKTLPPVPLSNIFLCHGPSSGGLTLHGSRDHSWYADARLLAPNHLQRYSGFGLSCEPRLNAWLLQPIVIQTVNKVNFSLLNFHDTILFYFLSSVSIFHAVPDFASCQSILTLKTA